MMTLDGQPAAPSAMLVRWEDWEALPGRFRGSMLPRAVGEALEGVYFTEMDAGRVAWELARRRPVDLSWAEVLRHFLESMKRWRAAGYPVVTWRQMLGRLRQCMGCQHWTAKLVPRCRKCGCTGLKLALATEACPVGRWVVVATASRALRD